MFYERCGREDNSYYGDASSVCWCGEEATYRCEGGPMGWCPNKVCWQHAYCEECYEIPEGFLDGRSCVVCAGYLVESVDHSTGLPEPGYTCEECGLKYDIEDEAEEVPEEVEFPEDEEMPEEDFVILSGNNLVAKVTCPHCEEYFVFAGEV